jgi:hypothetical protein
MSFVFPRPDALKNGSRMLANILMVSSVFVSPSATKPDTLSSVARAVPSRDFLSRAFIFVLLFPCGPSNVADFIIAIGVRVAVKTVLRTGPTTKLGVELLETLEEKLDTASAVSLVPDYALTGQVE